MIYTDGNFEDVILGSIIRDQSLYDSAITYGLSEENFSGQSLKVWQAIKNLKAENLAVDLITVSAKAPDTTSYLLRIYNENPTSKNFQWFCSQLVSFNKIKQCAINLSKLAGNMLEMRQDESTGPIVKEASAILSILTGLGSTPTRSSRFTGELLASTLERLETRIIDSKNGIYRGIKTGISKLDAQTAGLVNGRFYIIAARTSVGKTTFATFLALQAAMQQKNVLIFSNEMDAEDLVEKFISAKANVDSKLIQTGVLSEHQLDRVCKSVEELHKYPFAINQHYGWNLQTLESELYRLHAMGKCDVVFVDYTQQVSVHKSKSKQEQVSEVATRLKQISRDLNIPVVGLAQINRDTEKSGNPVLPGLANLKDSGALEQDADVVLILHKEDLSRSNTILRIAKNRMGETGVINLIHHLDTNKYSEV